MNPFETEVLADEPAPVASPAWAVRTDTGVVLFVPPTVRSLSTYVLLECERWFEPEMSLLPHLLQAGVHALDIGANHGVYTLEMARCSGHGRVLAFEPTAAPRACLLRSVQANGLQDRVTVVAAGLSDSPGRASFAVHDNSELNSREGEGARREDVHLETLDGHLAHEGIHLQFGFVKLDAEGDELRVMAGAKHFFASQSPVVMFEFKHGYAANHDLIDVWHDLGYAIFRWSAELELLLPFDAAHDETTFALNLVAVRPAAQETLGARGLLVTAQALRDVAPPRPTLLALQAWCSRPAVLSVMVPSAEALRAEVAAAAGEAYTQALCAVASAHLDAQLSPAQRVALIIQARDSMMQLAAERNGLSMPAWALVVHCQYALGRQRSAVETAMEMLQRWQPELAIEVPFVTPARRDLERPRTTPAGSWLRQALSEFVGIRSSLSSYFPDPDPARWAALLQHPDHSAAIERRYLLSHAMSGQVAALDRLTRLPDPAHTCNPGLWHGVIESMRTVARIATPPVPPTKPIARAEQPASPAEVLAGLPVAAVAVVDVGACSFGKDTEPYAGLVRAGRARVTGFEPNAAALQELRALNPDADTHCFLPHIVGDGQAAVFHEMAWPLTSSLYPPERAVLDRYHALGEKVQLAAQHPIDTVRLDDVIAPAGMDLLKIDVQGAERLVFDGARARLDECLVVWTEVEFAPLYRGQPLFGDIDARLREHGLHFLCFTDMAPCVLANWPLPTAQAPMPLPVRLQQLWADAIFVPSAERISAMSADAAARLALIAHHVLGAWDLCHAALLRFDGAHPSAAAPPFAPRYVSAMQRMRQGAGPTAQA